MAFVSGSAASFSDLLSALQSACTANGWTLNGNVLSKGVCFAEVTSVTDNFPYLRVRCGTGQSGGVLSGASDVDSSQIGLVHSGNPFAFPMNYFIHVMDDPIEVYFIVNYGSDRYQILAFGNAPGMSAGSGNWYTGTQQKYNQATVYFNTDTSGGDPKSYLSGGLFMGRLSGLGQGNVTGGVHSGLETPTWKIEGSARDWAGLIGRSPNTWNQESILIPIRVYAARASGFVSPVMECAHARFVSLANLNNQQVITLGTDRWRIYPWWSRGVNTFTVAGMIDSGTNGHAIRYDGP